MLNYSFLTKTTQQQSLVNYIKMKYYLEFLFLLSFKEQMRDMMQTPSLSRLRQTYLDPTMNLIFSQMRDEIDQSRKVRDEAQNELQAVQFTSNR
jgi:hypothetical protein